MGNEQQRHPRKCHERKLMTYPKELYFGMFVADCFTNYEGKSEKLKNILKSYYDRLPEPDRQRLLTIYRSMTPKQISDPVGW